MPSSVIEFCGGQGTSAEGREVLSCNRPLGHKGLHSQIVDYRKITHYPWHEVSRNFLRQVKAGRIGFQTWNCDECGAKESMAQSNALYWEGECENCGHVTDLRRKGFNFTLIVGVNVKREDIRELIKDTGYKPPMDDN